MKNERKGVKIENSTHRKGLSFGLVFDGEVLFEADLNVKIQ